MIPDNTLIDMALIDMDRERLSDRRRLTLRDRPHAIPINLITMMAQSTVAMGSTPDRSGGPQPWGINAPIDNPTEVAGHNSSLPQGKQQAI